METKYRKQSYCMHSTVGKCLWYRDTYWILTLGHFGRSTLGTTFTAKTKVFIYKVVSNYCSIVSSYLKEGRKKIFHQSIHIPSINLHHRVVLDIIVISNTITQSCTCMTNGLYFGNDGQGPLLPITQIGITLSVATQPDDDDTVQWLAYFQGSLLSDVLLHPSVMSTVDKQTPLFAYHSNRLLTHCHSSREIKFNQTIWMYVQWTPRWDRSFILVLNAEVK